MGLSSKQVSRDGVGWSQSLLQAQTLELPKANSAMKRQNPQNQQQQQSEAVTCPRCDSTNTKFCYYNNYNKSQPRHFCKACKRHWTKGGTLRNVPVGGGRKNKRIKTSNPNKSASASASASAAATTTTPAIKSSSSSGVNNNRLNTFMAIHQSQQQQQKQDLDQLPLADHQKNVSSNLQFRPPSSLLLQQNSIINCSSLDHSKNFISTSINNGVFLQGSTSTLSNLPQTSQGLQLPFSISTSTSFDTTPSSISTSFQSSSIYNYAGEPMDTSSTFSLPWQLPITSSSDMDMANYWNWDEIDALVSTTDLNVPWDDSEIKP